MVSARWPSFTCRHPLRAIREMISKNHFLFCLIQMRWIRSDCRRAWRVVLFFPMPIWALEKNFPTELSQMESTSLLEQPPLYNRHSSHKVTAYSPYYNKSFITRIKTARKMISLELFWLLIKAASIFWIFSFSLRRYPLAIPLNSSELHFLGASSAMDRLCLLDSLY